MYAQCFVVTGKKKIKYRDKNILAHTYKDTTGYTTWIAYRDWIHWIHAWLTNITPSIQQHNIKKKYTV